MKKILCVILCIALGVCLVSCGCENSDENIVNETQADTAGNISEFVLTDSAVEEVLILEVGDAEIIRIDGISEEQMEKISWSSGDESVATVDDAGRVDAVKEGVTSIIIENDESKIQCSVKVVANEDSQLQYSTALTANHSVLEDNIRNFDGSKMLYYIKVNRQENCVTVYTYDKNGEYTIPIRAMICSSGADNGTITGEFSIYYKADWNPLFGDVYGKYVSGFSGDYLFHSVPYFYAESDTLEVEEYNKLGTSASMGCIRMAVADTKWIFDNCNVGTEVLVYDDADPGPLGRPESMHITDLLNGWDPTDDDPINPYNSKKPVISGAKDLQIRKGEEVNLLENITAIDTCSNDITANVKVKGRVYNNKPGTYTISYIATDAMYRTDRVDVTVTVV
ncbi:MAG: L,D-transpeptidase family protein [Ruminococcus sp.]|nr:L,D-transpeptidase family protein [Ruminococcus sp.]